MYHITKVSSAQVLNHSSRLFITAENLSAESAGAGGVTHTVTSHFAQILSEAGVAELQASHFAPALLEKALHVYRSTFNPSKWASKPNVMICAGVCAAEQTDEALFLRSSQMISFANLMMGKPSKLAPPNMNIKRLIPPVVLAQVEQTFSCSAVGDAETIEKQIKSILDRFQPDELMITGAIYDHDIK